MSARYNNSRTLFFSSLLFSIALSSGCGDEPTPTGVGPRYGNSFSEIDSFEAGGRIAAICGDGTGNVFCGTLGLDRYGDGWTVYQQGAVIRFDGSSWSAPLYDIHATIYDLDMWAASADDVYLADGMLRHFDGVSWTSVGIPADVVCGNGPSDIYVASTNDKSVRHYDGSKWILLREVGGPTNGDDDIEAIFSLPGFAAVLRSHGIATWDGVSWTDKQFEHSDYVYDVWGTAPNNLYVVGNPYSIEGEIIHFDGISWSYPAIPETPQLQSIWGSGPSDIYAVGAHGAILHYNGTSWVGVKNVTDKALREVWGSGPSDVFAVGDDGKALHFDGLAWSSIRKDKPDHHIFSMWAESPTRFAVTDWIDRSTVYLYDNGKWRETYVGTTGGVGRLAGRSLDDLYTLGDPGVFHFNGTDWSYDSYLDTYFPGELWIPDEPYSGFAIGGGSVFQFKGGQWKEVVAGQPWYMASIWGASWDDVYAINSTGIVNHYDGDSWSTITSPADQLIDMWGVSATEIYVLAGDINMPTGLFRYDGATWHAVKAPSSPYGETLMLSSYRNMFVWGGCWLSHFDGAKWTTECSPETPVDLVEARDGSILKVTERAVSRQVFAPFSK